MQFTQAFTLIALLSTAASRPAANHDARQLGAPVGVIGVSGQPSAAFIGAEPPTATAGAGTGAGAGNGGGAGVGAGAGAKGAKKAGQQACNNGAQAPNPTGAAVAARQLGAPVGVVGANGQPSAAFIGAEPPAATAGAQAGAKAGNAGKKTGAVTSANPAGQNQVAKKATGGAANCAN